MSGKTFEGTDAALLAAFLLIASLGTWNSCLLFNDGIVFLSVGWLGDAWDLYFRQFASRIAAMLPTFGPAWLARWAFGLSSSTYIIVAHALYFAVPLGLWLAIRCRATARVLAAVPRCCAGAGLFPNGTDCRRGLWMIWVAVLADAARPVRQAAVATIGLGLAMAFTHQRWPS